MEEQWHIRIKDAYINLSNFIESNKLTTPYDEISLNFMTSVALLKKADASDLKKSMRDVILGSSTYEGKVYSNIELMKGFELTKGGFIIYDAKTDKNLSGPFMKSDFVFSFISKQLTPDGVTLPVTAEIRTRNVLDNMVKRYASDLKKRNDFINAWYYSTSCLADSFTYFMNHYCLKEVSQEDRNTILSKIPKACLSVKPLGNSINLNNITKLANSIVSNKQLSSLFQSAGVNVNTVKHFIDAASEKGNGIDLDQIKNTAINAINTGEIDGLGSTMMNVIKTFSNCMPSVDTGSTDEQD